MSGVPALVALTVLVVVGCAVAVRGWSPSTPGIERTLAHLTRDATQDVGASAGRTGVVEASIERLVTTWPGVLPTDVELQLVGRTRSGHVTVSMLAMLVGLVAPGVLLGVLRAAGLLGLGLVLPVVGSLVGAVVGPLLVRSSTVDRAARVVTDLRHQTSAYLDVVTMLLAANTGYEGALEQASHAGDGRLFVELRRRMRESGTRGASLTEALHRTGVELGLPELEQVAATAALGASQGAPVARTLAAKCATLRAALATEQESEARLRTSRLTAPIVGMALVFMGLVIYPALNLS